jgi:hypothetical protein
LEVNVVAAAGEGEPALQSISFLSLNRRDPFHVDAHGARRGDEERFFFEMAVHPAVQWDSACKTRFLMQDRLSNPMPLAGMSRISRQRTEGPTNLFVAVIEWPLGCDGSVIQSREPVATVKALPCG